MALDPLTAYSTVFVPFFAAHPFARQVILTKSADVGWLLPLLGSSQNTHTLHHLGMWVLVTFAIIHIYAAIREDIMSRQSIISSMVSGERICDIVVSPSEASCVKQAAIFLSRNSQLTRAVVFFLPRVVWLPGSFEPGSEQIFPVAGRFLHEPPPLGM